MAFAKLVSGILVLSTVSALVAVGCGGKDTLPPLDGSGTGDPDGGGIDPNKPGGNDRICLLNNCDKDRDCQDCTGSRTTCNQKEHRCVACGPDAAGKSCVAGQTCTKYGDCVPGGVACPEDADGKPTISCNGDADCAACGPSYKICDPGAKKCVGCTTTNVTNCQSTDVCKGTACVPACPAACTKDEDCGSCGATGAENHACNRGVCAKCSPTKNCAGGNESCNDVGDCEKVCGLANNPNKCNTDGDCSACMGGLTKCQKAIGGAIGTCVAPAAGCEDLGKGVFVLPDPFSRVTQACSTDANCANTSASFDVGALIKKATGLNIGSATLDYPMHACASVDILDGKKCGVCVPCKKDGDCTPIDVQKFAGDAFGPLGSIAAAILLDKVFGPSDRKVHMYCQKIAGVANGEYGACVPCPSFFQRCGDAAVDSEPATACDHAVCAVGPALGATCEGGCAGRVGLKDPFCVSKLGFWDAKCKALVETECTNVTCTPNSCAAPRDAGWYCRQDGSEGGYRCAGGELGQSTAEGRQCPASPAKTYCHRQNPSDVKSKAVLCTSASEQGCDAANVGKPKCFPTP